MECLSQKLRKHLVENITQGEDLVLLYLGTSLCYCVFIDVYHLYISISLYCPAFMIVEKVVLYICILLPISTTKCYDLGPGK